MLLNWKISSELQIKDMCFLSNQLLSLTFNITEKPKLLWWEIDTPFGFTHEFGQIRRAAYKSKTCNNKTKIQSWNLDQGPSFLQCK